MELHIDTTSKNTHKREYIIPKAIKKTHQKTTNMISNRNKLILASGRDIYISSILSLCGYLAKLNIEPNETEYFNPEYHTNIPFSNYYSKLETFWIFSFFSLYSLI